MSIRMCPVGAGCSKRTEPYLCKWVRLFLFYIGVPSLATKRGLKLGGCSCLFFLCGVVLDSQRDRDLVCLPPFATGSPAQGCVDGVAGRAMGISPGRDGLPFSFEFLLCLIRGQ